MNVDCLISLLMPQEVGQLGSLVLLLSFSFIAQKLFHSVLCNYNNDLRFHEQCARLYYIYCLWYFSAFLKALFTW